MGVDKIFDIIGVVASWWTPEKVKARARQKLKRLQEERNDLLNKPATEKTSTRLVVIMRDINRLQSYLANS
jgi:hypothetical protein